MWKFSLQKGPDGTTLTSFRYLRKGTLWCPNTPYLFGVGYCVGYLLQGSFHNLRQDFGFNSTLSFYINRVIRGWITIFTFMMARKNLFALISLCSLMTYGCTGVIEDGKDDGGKDQNQTVAVSITGSAQKGPFTKGSQITAFPLDETLTATGQSFPGTIIDNLGNFRINGNCSDPYLELRADGYYYSEFYGTVSEAPLYLEALVSPNSSRVNLNLLTTVINPRVKKLILDGASYDAAVGQAQSEFATTMGIEVDENLDFDELSIVGTTDMDALLLAISCLMEQGRTTGQVSALIQEMAFDFEDGEMSKTTLDKLNEYYDCIPVTSVVTNLTEYYKSNGVEDVTIPDFWKYVQDNEDYVSVMDFRFTKGIYANQTCLYIVDAALTVEKEIEYTERYASAGVQFWTCGEYDKNLSQYYGKTTFDLTTYQVNDNQGWTSDVSWITISPAVKIDNNTYKYTITLDPDIEGPSTGDLLWEDSNEMFWGEKAFAKPTALDTEIFNVTEKPILVTMYGKKQSSIFVNGVEYEMFALPQPEGSMITEGRSITFIPKSDAYEITNNKGRAYNVEPLGEYVLSIQ